MHGHACGDYHVRQTRTGGCRVRRLLTFRDQNRHFADSVSEASPRVTLTNLDISEPQVGTRTGEGFSDKEEQVAKDAKAKALAEADKEAERAASIPRSSSLQTHSNAVL